MKNGTLYAKRVKDLYHKLKAQAEKTEPEAPTEPTEQLVVALLGETTSLESGRRALGRLLERMIDLNEIRVSSVNEVAAALGDCVPDPEARADALIRALNAVFRKEHAVSLAKLAGKGMREARAYLESLDGMSPFAAAAVVHWSLHGHAIPVSVPMLSALKAAQLAHPDARLDEVQAFLERNISAGEAHQFVVTMEPFAHARPASRVPNAEGAGKPTRSRAGRPPAQRQAAKRKGHSGAK